MIFRNKIGFIIVWIRSINIEVENPKDMKGKWQFVIVVGMILLAVFLVLVFTESKQEVCIRDQCYDVELAETPEERQQGLMYRDHLARNSGMLFVFEESKAHQFWMKNTLIPLDIIWINAEYRVVEILQNVQPCEEDPCPVYGSLDTEALYVLELNAGEVKRVGLEVRDSVEIK